MRIGVPRETKEGERRVALLPPQVAALAREGHEIVVEHDAGAAVGCGDDAYAGAGARIVEAEEAWRADLVVKVKEVQPADLPRIPEGATIFSFHQLPGEPQRTRELAFRRVTAIGFELLPDLLAPMSMIAGRMAVEEAARLLRHAPRKVLVLGAGTAGLESARTAAAMGSSVVVLTRSQSSVDRARAMGFDAAIASPRSIETHALEADLLVGAVLIPGAPTPKLVPRSLVRRMRRGAVIADVCIDGGGVAETSRTTSHAEPTFVDEGVVHYCIPNIPAASPREAAAALSEAVLPHVRRIAEQGVEAAIRGDPALRAAVFLWRGQVRHPEIAAEAGLAYNDELP